jgi:hypothetical protein
MLWKDTKKNFITSVEPLLELCQTSIKYKVIFKVENCNFYKTNIQFEASMLKIILCYL